MSIKAENLSMSSKIYIAYADKIVYRKILSIKQVNNELRLSMDNSYNTITVLPDSEYFEYCDNTYFLNFEDAQKEQERIRKNEIERKFCLMSEAITSYNEVILKYFNKPLSTIEES